MVGTLAECIQCIQSVKLVMLDGGRYQLLRSDVFIMM